MFSGSVTFSGLVTFSGSVTFSGFVSFSSGFPVDAEEEQICRLEMNSSPYGQTLQACFSKSKR